MNLKIFNVLRGRSYKKCNKVINDFWLSKSKEQEIKMFTITLKLIERSVYLSNNYMTYLGPHPITFFDNKTVHKGFIYCSWVLMSKELRTVKVYKYIQQNKK